jgi:hypothetical protein
MDFFLVPTFFAIIGARSEKEQKCGMKGRSDQSSQMKKRLVGSITGYSRPNCVGALKRKWNGFEFFYRKKGKFQRLSAKKRWILQACAICCPSSGELCRSDQCASEQRRRIRLNERRVARVKNELVVSCWGGGKWNENENDKATQCGVHSVTEAPRRRTGSS